MHHPKWSNGALVAVQNDDTVNPLLWVIEGGRQGPRAIPFTVPGSQSMLIYDWDRGADGTLAVSGNAVDPDGRWATFIAWIDSNGRDSQVVRTSPYRPSKVAVAPDGTIWTAGREYAAPTRGTRLVPHAGVIRHFDRSGKLLGEFVRQATIGDHLILSNTSSVLRVSRDRVAWCSVNGRYVEISLDGNVLTDISTKLPGDESTREMTGFALTDSNEAFLGAAYIVSSNGGSPVWLRAVYVLNRSTKTWTPVLQRMATAGEAPDAKDNFVNVYGADGNKLILSAHRRIKFYKIGQ